MRTRKAIRLRYVVVPRSSSPVNVYVLGTEYRSNEWAVDRNGSASYMLLYPCYMYVDIRWFGVPAWREFSRGPFVVWRASSKQGADRKKSN